MRTPYLFAAATVACLIANAGRAIAQTQIPPVEIFAGYSYLPADGNDFPRTSSRGFQTTVSANLNSWASVDVDLAGHYSHTANLGPNFRDLTVDTSVYEFLVGPRFTARGRVSPFVHALAGTARGQTSLGGFSDSGFTLAVGGGADAIITRRVAARVQMDALGSFADILEKNLRVGAGVVVKLGR